MGAIGGFQPAGVCAAESLNLTINEVIANVLRYNHDIEQARLQWLASKHALQAAAGAFEPDVVGSLEKSRLERENSTVQLLEQGGLGEFSQKDKKYGVGIEGALSSGGNYHIGYDLDKQRSNLSPEHEYVSFAGITVEQPLLRGVWFGSATAPVRIARQERAIAFQKYRKEIMSVVLRAESRYWGLVFAQEDFRIAQDSVEIAEKILRDAQQRLETGAMSDMDMEAAQSELAVRQAQAEESRQNLLDVVTQLKLLLGNERVAAEQAIHASDELLPAEEELEVVAEAHGDMLAQAYLEQPDLLASQEELKKEDVVLTQRRDRLLPQLNLKGSYGYNGLGDSEAQAWDKLKEEDFPSYNMGLEMRIPLLCGVTERHELAAARLQRQAASQRLNRKLPILLMSCFRLLIPAVIA